MGAGGRRSAAFKRAQAGGDPYWANVVVCCNFTADLVNANPGGPAISQHKGTPVTQSGGYAVFGGNSGLQYSKSGGFGSSDWALDIVYNATGNASEGYNIIAGSTWPNAGSFFLIWNLAAQANKLTLFDANVSTVTPAIIPSGTQSLNDGLDHNIQISRTGNTIAMYSDGALLGSYTAVAGSFTSADQIIGAYPFAEMLAKLSAYRLTVGANRGYTGATIIPPTLPYPES